MYINPFAAGVFATIFTELLVLTAIGIIATTKK